MADNVVATKGLERLAEIFKDDVDQCAIGTGTTTPTSADTQLVTETDRNAITTALRSGKQAQLRTYFTNAELPTTVRELGWFMAASGVPNNGQLFLRALHTFVAGSNDVIFVLNVDFEEKT